MMKIELPYVKKNSLYLLAISGGLDSVCLLDLLSRQHISLILVHVNYHLRGADSNKDQELVQNLAAKYNYPIEILDLQESIPHQNLQNTARKLRYDFFKKIYQQFNCAGLFTAHHADDNFESLLLHMSRGCGLNGLRAMKDHDQLNEMRIYRPLLQFSKNDLLEYAQKNELEWREDSSNDSLKYDRNKLRHTVIPAWQQIYPHLQDTIQQNQSHWQEGLDWHYQTIEKELKKLCTHHNDQVHISISAIKKHPHGQYLLAEYALRHNASSGQIKEILHLLDAPIGKYVQIDSIKCFRDRRALIFTDSHTQVTQVISIPSCGEYEFKGKLIVEECTERPATFTDVNAIYLDADKLEWPLLIRPWQEGDYFYPFGLNKKKKISRLLIDAKIALPDKPNVHVLLSGNYIVWVIGMRSDHRFRITEKTKKIIKITHAH